MCSCMIICVMCLSYLNIKKSILILQRSLHFVDVVFYHLRYDSWCYAAVDPHPTTLFDSPTAYSLHVSSVALICKYDNVYINGNSYNISY